MPAGFGIHFPKGTLLFSAIFLSTALAGAQCGDPPYTMATWASLCRKYGGHVSSDGRQCLGWDRNWCNRGAATSPTPPDTTGDLERQRAAEERLKKEEEEQRKVREKREAEERFQREKEEALKSLKGVSDGSDTLKGVSSDSSELKGILPNGLALKEASPTNVDLKKPADSRKLVTPSEYRSAKTKLKRLQTLVAALLVKQEQLRGWRGDLTKYNREFEQLRAEAAYGELCEILETIPAAEIVEGLAQSPKYAKYVTPALAKSFRYSYATLKLAVMSTDLYTARNNTQQIDTALSATLNVRKQLMDLGLDGLRADDPARVLVDRMQKTIGVTARVLTFVVAQTSDTSQSKSPTDTFERAANLGLDVAVILSPFPPVGVAVATTRVALREAQKYQIKKATDSLQGALADNWNADIYLDQKVQQVRSEIAELKRAVDSCEAVHCDN